MKKMLPVTLVLVALLAAPPAGWAGPPTAGKTVLITPFRFYAAQDVAFLNHGILEMLTTRLLRAGTIRVRQWGKSPFDQAEAVELAGKQDADYILIGGITIFDNRVSTDARLIQTEGGRAVLLFSRFGRRPGDVLEHMDALAGEIAGVFEAGAAQ